LEVENVRPDQSLGVALNGRQMRFDLPGFLGQRVEAGDEGLLFGQWRQRDFYAEKLSWTNRVTPRPIPFAFPWSCRQTASRLQYQARKRVSSFSESARKVGKTGDKTSRQTPLEFAQQHLPML
jgi:hypothetical protein